jgi:hypothetical protein
MSEKYIMRVVQQKGVEKKRKAFFFLKSKYVIMRLCT